MQGSQMTLENICAVEAFFGRRARPRAEPTYHGTFVMGQSMAIFVVFSRKSFMVILARYNRTLLGSFRLVSEHVGFQVLEQPTAVGIGATASFLAIFLETEACGSCVFLGYP